MCETHKLPLAQTCVHGIVTCHAMNAIENNNNRTIFAYSNECNSKSSGSNNNSLGGRSHVCFGTRNGFHYVNELRV
jgi:hypothetical protein